ncbi:MAG: carboxypeptidase regulatory-like domain-containing protein [Anaerolineales bacterium]|nr:carboxypeptidase regulatory-like domain-containing protein [Anaerolineales bacterium]
MKIGQGCRIRVVIFPIALLVLLACNLQRTAASPSAEFTATRTVFPPSESGEAPATPSGTVPAENPTLTQAFTPTSTIIHLTTPPGTTGTTRYITDPETRDYAPQKKSPSGSDAHQNNRWERPYTAGTMDYLADVDLTRVELRIAAPWVYILFFIAGPRAEGIGETMYGAEFDVNRDGRGDYLIWGASPAGADWTVDGVEVWTDSNADVGGPNGQLTDAPWTGGDGYDQKLFSGGQGADPDLAWIRQMEGGLKIQLAFKASAIGNAPAFLWNGLADNGIRRPDWFDYNDHFTQDEAGSPLTAQADYYPLKALSGIDNTCRDAYGFAPAGSEPGLCLYEGSIRGQVAWDIDHSGSLDSTELSVAMIAGDTVTLGQGLCPAAGYRTAVTDAEGRYSFAALSPGAYCVGLIHTVPNPISIAPVPVNLSPGENGVVNMPVPW